LRPLAYPNQYSDTENLFFRPVTAAGEAFTARRYERCRAIVEGSEKVGQWEQDHSLPIDPDTTRNAVIMTASAPI